MKEFGIYTLKENFIEEFSEQVPTLLNLSGTARPFICIKIGGKNWLLYCGSIDPARENYASKNAKFNEFRLIDEQCEVRALHIFSDVTKLHSNADFKSVVQYYSAFPVKSKYVKKYWDNPRDKANRKHCMLEKALRKLVKNSLIRYLNARSRGEIPGFLGEKVKSGKTQFARYPIDYEAIQKALYQAQKALKVKRIQKSKVIEDTKAARAGVRDIKSFLRRYRVAENDAARKQLAAELRRRRPKLFAAAHKYAESSARLEEAQRKPEE